MSTCNNGLDWILLLEDYQMDGMINTDPDYFY